MIHNDKGMGCNAHLEKSLSAAGASCRRRKRGINGAKRRGKGMFARCTRRRCWWEGRSKGMCASRCDWIGNPKRRHWPGIVHIFWLLAQELLGPCDINWYPLIRAALARFASGIILAEHPLIGLLSERIIF